MKTQLRPCLLVMMASLCPAQIKQTQDEEKKQLTALRDLIKSSLQLDQKEVGRSQTGTGEDQFNLQHLFLFFNHTHTHTLSHSQVWSERPVLYHAGSQCVVGFCW